MKKTLAIVLMALLTVTLLIGCAPVETKSPAETQQQPATDTSTTAPSTDADKPVVIEVFHYMLQNTKQAALEAVEAAYMAKNPNVTFKNTFYNQGTDYFPQLSTALASGELPNIIMGNPGLYPDVVSEGYAMDLSIMKL